MKTINIMTSCDFHLMKFIPIQLESIAANLKDRKVNFYLFHDGKNQIYVDKLKKINYKNVNLKDIVVKNTEIYDEIAVRGGHWSGAAYYSLCAHQYLPADMDRILYIDAGDVLIIGNIDDYYFEDFEDKAIIATSNKFKVINDEFILFEKKDLMNQNLLPGIARGLFNSGSYVINLNKMRQKNYTIHQYATCAELLYDIRGKINQTYFGDQGFISLMFIGDLKIHAYPHIKNVWYMPYNFCMWYFDKMRQKPDYETPILHYTGGCAFKPWLGNYPIFLNRFQNKQKLKSLNTLQLGQAQYYFLWHEYAILTDIRLDNLAIEGL